MHEDYYSDIKKEKSPRRRRLVTPEKAYEHATARCAAAEYCVGDWLRRFATMGLGRTDAEQLTDRLVDEGFIDEARYARAFVHDKANYDRWGPIKIRQGLKAKGIGGSDISAALDDVDPGLWRDNLRVLLQRKVRTLDADAPAKRREKLVRYAAGRGYGADLIFSVLDSLESGGEDENDFNL